MYVIVDIDGTISKVGSRMKYLQQDPPDYESYYKDDFDDEPIHTIIALLFALEKYGYRIVFCTARLEIARYKTTQWIFKHFGWQVGEKNLLMRADGDYRPDEIIKPELLEKAGIELFKIDFVLEDKPLMVARWRELGVTCLQVAEGKDYV